MTMTRCVMAAALVLGLSVVAAGQSDATTQPAQAEANQSARPRATVTDDVRPLLDAVAKAYREVQSLTMQGTIVGEFDVLGRQRREVKEFTAAYRAPMAFRHVIEGDVQAGSNGQTLYVYTQRSNLYRTDEQPKEKATFDKLPAPLVRIVSFQNPALTLALSSDPEHELTDNVTALTRREDVTIDGRDHPVLHLVLGNGDGLELRFDPQTHLIRQAVFDLRAGMEKGGAVDVKKATVTVDYAQQEAGVELDDERFAWAPPAGARDVQAVASAREAMQAGFRQIEGKPAPAFDLPKLGGGRMSLEDLKGEVVLLDFWATWCGPCVMSMPQLEQMHKEKEGLKVVTIDIGEDQARVQKFISSKGYTFPVLLDTSSAVARAYGADRAIPYQVLIGRDGVVRKVVVGAGGAAKAEMEAAIHAALTAED